MSDTQPLHEAKSQPPSMSEILSKIKIVRAEWMANKINIEDEHFWKVVQEVIALLPTDPSVEQISRAVRKRNSVHEQKISTEPEQVERVLQKNRDPLVGRFKSGDTPNIGEYFDEEMPANVCQLNVLLMSAVAAYYGFEVSVSPFIYTGSQSGKERLHAVGIYQDAGKEYVLDPTLAVPKYGDVDFLPKEEYLNRFTRPQLATYFVQIFQPQRE